jgi:hypothetical protein
MQPTSHSTDLRSSEGRNFVSFLFTLHLPFVDHLHAVIKNQLPLWYVVQRQVT